MGRITPAIGTRQRKTNCKAPQETGTCLKDILTYPPQFVL